MQSSRHPNHSRCGRRASVAAFRRAEDGAVSVLSVFLLLAVLMICGFAMDLMRNEYDRARLQNALDRAVLTAAADAEKDASAVVTDSLVSEALSDRLTSVKDTPGSTEREISAIAQDDTATMLSGLVGLDSLAAPAAATAHVPRRATEISLVLDISGSMRFVEDGRPRIDFLRDGVRSFNDRVLAPGRDSETSVNLVPFAGQVNPGRTLFERLGGERWHTRSSCKEVTQEEYLSPGLPEDSRLQVPHFMEWTIDDASMDWGWCPSDDAAVMVAQNDPDKLNAYFDSLRLHDGTGTQIGMKYGLGLLDPSSWSHFQELAYNGHIPPQFGNRPLPFSERVRKYAVLVTDGGVTDQSRPSDATYEDIYCEDPEEEAPDQSPSGSNPDPDGDGLVTLYFAGHQVASTDNVNQQADNRSHLDVRKLFSDVRLENGSTVDRIEVVVELSELERHPGTGELNFLEKRQGDNNTTIRTMTVVMSDGERFTIKDSSPIDFREQDTSKVGDGAVGSIGRLHGDSFTPEHGDIFVESNSSVDLVYANTNQDAPDGDDQTRCEDGTCYEVSTFRHLGGENLMFTTRPEGFDPGQTNIFAIDVSDDTSDTYGDGLFTVNDAVLNFGEGSSGSTTASTGDSTAESNEATIDNADPDSDGLIRLYFRPDQVASTDNVNQRGDNRSHFDLIRRMDSVELSNGSRVDFIEVVIPTDETWVHPGTEELDFLEKRQGDNNTTAQAINVVMTDGQVFEVKHGSPIDFREQDTSKVGDGSIGALGPLQGDSFTPHHGDTFIETNSSVDLVYRGTNTDAPDDPNGTEFYHIDGNNWMFTSNPAGLDMSGTNVMAIDISDDTSDTFGDGLFTVTNGLLVHAGDEDTADVELDYQNACNAAIRDTYGDSEDGLTEEQYPLTEIFTESQDLDRHDEITNISSLRAQCAQARTSGVTVYTVGIETDATIAAELEACASSPGHAFDISAGETDAVLKSIANAIRRGGVRQ